MEYNQCLKSNVWKDEQWKAGGNKDQNEIKDVKVAVCYSDSVYRCIQSVVSFLYCQYGINCIDKFKIVPILY